jgi:ubiquitin carboxyl-terminal hydrolase 7
VATVENQLVDDPQTGKFTWTIENFSKINLRKHYSETFTVGGYKWYGRYSSPILFDFKN